MDDKIGSVVGTGQCEMCVNFVHKFCERKKNVIYVIVYGKIILLRILGSSV